MKFKFWFMKNMFNLHRIMRYWKTKSGHYDKGGSFNLILYLQYLKARQ
jgi:hypothetical protein